MPYITINLMEGHSKAQKIELYKSVTQAVANSLDLPEEYVRIQLVEMKPENHAIAGTMLEDNK